MRYVATAIETETGRWILVGIIPAHLVGQTYSTKEAALDALHQAIAL